MTDRDTAVERSQYCRRKLDKVLIFVFSKAGRGCTQRHLSADDDEQST